MDATEDRDLKLQRDSADLIGELKSSLPAFLRHSLAQHHDNDPGTLRKFVWWETLRDLVKLLEPFQEWPQLLDPHLSILLPPLNNAFLDYVDEYNHKRPSHRSKARILPLSVAICKLLYSFCKIRGAKVISSFFSNEPRWIEPILSALHNWDKLEKHPVDEWQQSSGLSWEEKYIMLTWLSHLMLTPFDLGSISSAEVVESYQLSSSFKGPPSIPPLAKNAIVASTSHLTSASKERDAAALLLVRLALRPDMQRDGMVQFLMQWVLKSLTKHGDSSPSLYESLAHLSILAKICSSADAHVAEPHFDPIFECVKDIASAQSSSSAALYSSALTRKSLVKIVRSIATLALQIGRGDGQVTPSLEAYDISEEVIEFLLSACSDKDTPVRFAASKAIGVIGLKLDSEQSTQVAQAIIQGIEEEVYWEESILDQLIYGDPGVTTSKRQLRSRNLNGVSALAWQGLTLSLANLLFRRCLLPLLLPETLNALLLALSFEQRTPTGVSMGSNVRDAACYGIWSLARRYSTAELLSVDTSTITVIAKSGEPLSVLQILANELVVTSSMDPSGNIRRGASAALQEMVGRHPDCIQHGIALIQILEDRAVALRSRALTEVGPRSSELDMIYWEALFEGLLGWRALGSPDAATRRLAAKSFGLLSATHGLDIFLMAIDRIQRRLVKIGWRAPDKRHGLILALVAALERFDTFAELETRIQATSSINRLWDLLLLGTDGAEWGFSSKASHPQLNAEAACLLIAALSRNLYKNSLGGTNYGMVPEHVLADCVAVITFSFERKEQLVVDSAVKALQELFPLLEEQDRRLCIARLLSHIDPKWDVSGYRGGRGTRRVEGYLAGLGAVFDQINEEDPVRETIFDVFITFLQPENSVETRVATLASLKHGIIQSKGTSIPLVEAIQSCLEDYTTDQRGDVGSLVRIEAIDVVMLAWQPKIFDMIKSQAVFPDIVRLAAEKLDKVRLRAWRGLCRIPNIGDVPGLGRQYLEEMDVSSEKYFLALLSFPKSFSVREALLEGFVTSAGTGSELVLKAARNALATHLHSLDGNGLRDFFAAFNNLLETSSTKERLAVSVLEVLAFILDTRILGGLKESASDVKKTLFLVQKSHYKSTSMPKLKAAIEAYVGLCSLPPVKDQVLTKLRTMLLHPYPQIRDATADALFSVTREDWILHINWAKDPKELKSVVTEIGIMAENA